MDTNEIMTNDVVKSTIEEVPVESCSCKALKAVAGIGLVCICGYFVCKYIVNPAIKKYKDKSNEKLFKDEAESINECSDGDDESGYSEEK